ncbi:hypothetical protein MTR_5g091145 [Medicago truncatula]|uniref:Uncharacterized protein n=1 Tax=Medicago truncatula TaxID=3880 RepID=A0A072UG75_MEDTR|nr:hypothetical protein MTR_5g091145 [Medicago truncatula]
MNTHSPFSSLWQHVRDYMKKDWNVTLHRILCEKMRQKWNAKLMAKSNLQVSARISCKASTAQHEISLAISVDSTSVMSISSDCSLLAFEFHSRKLAFYSMQTRHDLYPKV